VKERKNIVELVLIVVALALSIASVVLGMVKAATPEALVAFLGLGLLALSLAALQKARA